MLGHNETSFKVVDRVSSQGDALWYVLLKVTIIALYY